MIAESRRYPLWMVRALRIAFFVVLLALSAKIRIQLTTAIPFTAQTLAVFLAGLVLGPVEGAISVAAYVGAIAAGLPLDTFGRGAAVFATPTAGYLISFIPAAFVAGLAWRTKGNRRFMLNILCGFLAMVIVLLIGTAGVALINGLSWANALVLGLYPFVLTEPGKVLLAAALVKLGHESWLRWFVSSNLPTKL
jgi:biotin transport system substrate-specific component